MFWVLGSVSSSSENSCKSGSEKVDAAGQRLSNLRVGAKFLPEADHDERVDDSVEKTFHRAILGERFLTCERHSRVSLVRLSRVKKKIF